MSIHINRPQQAQRAVTLCDPPPTQAFLVTIARDVSGIVFDRPAHAAPTDRRERLAVLSGDGAVSGPVISTELEMQRGAVRHLALIETAAERLATAGVAVLRGDRRIATLDADWLQSPVRASSALFHDLAFAGRTRLLKLLLANAASLFRIGEDPAFAQTVADLVGQTAIPEVRVESMCEIGRGVVLTLLLNDEQRDTRNAHFALIMSGRAGLVSNAKSLHDGARGSERVHVCLPRAPGRYSRLIGFCGATTPFMANLDPLRVIPFAQWLRRASPAAQTWGHQRLQASVQPDAWARALGDALASGVEAAPEFNLRSVSGTEAGVLLAADITDPLGQVRGVVVERDEARVEIAIDTLAGGPLIAATTPLCGFFEVRREGPHIRPSRIRLAYHSGRLQTVFEERIPAFSGTPDAALARPGAGESLNAAMHRAAPAIGRAMATRARPPIAVRTTRFGRGADRCRLTIVAPMPSDPDVLRARSATVFAAGGVDVAFVYHWAAHADDAARMAAIEDVHALHNAPYLAVVTEPHRTDAERLQAALRATRGPVIVLGPSVLPTSPGWLRAWSRSLAASSPVSVIGATLLSAHGGVLDAGGRVSVNQAGGLVVTPRTLSPQTRRGVGDATGGRRTAPTGWASAAAVGLKPAAVSMLCESTTPLRDPDFLVVETIARLKARGSGAVTLLHAPFADFAEPPQPEPLSLAVDSIILADSLRAIEGLFPHPQREAS